MPLLTLSITLHALLAIFNAFKGCTARFLPSCACFDEDSLQKITQAPLKLTIALDLNSKQNKNSLYFAYSPQYACTDATHAFLKSLYLLLKLEYFSSHMSQYAFIWAVISLKRYCLRTQYQILLTNIIYICDHRTVQNHMGI